MSCQTILFNQVEAPSKNESITKISQKGVDKKVSQEIKVYDEEYHLSIADESIRSLYNEFKDLIFSIGDDIISKPKAKYVSFIRKTNFVDVVIRKSSIDLYLNLRKGILNDPKKICRNVSKVGHWKNGDYEIKLTDLKNSSYILTLVRQSYEKLIS